MNRIVLVDDHAIMRESLKLVLEAAGFAVVGEAGDGREALQLIALLDPDIAIVDIEMPVIGGMDVLRQLVNQGRRARVLLLSRHQSLRHVQDAIAAGAWGYVVKEADSRILIQAVKAVLGGRRYYCTELSEQLSDLLQKPAGEPDAMASLSTREHQILRLVLDSRSNAEIAGLLFLSVKTVETYRSRLMQKLGVSDVVGLVKYMMRRESQETTEPDGRPAPAPAATPPAIPTPTRKKP